MTGGLTSGVTSTEVMFIVCPEHAAIFARDGFSKAALRNELFSLARVPFDKFSDENLELLSKRRPAWFAPGARQIGAVDKAQDIWLVVAGGSGGKSAYIPGRTATRLQTVEVD
jgi:predicted P-loop ATPase/GTPase